MICSFVLTLQAYSCFSIYPRSPRFEARLIELRAFIAEHGHMDIGPHTIKSDRKLYDWIRRQRLRLEAYPNRYMQYSPMTQAEFDALDAIGFDWGGD